MSEWREVTREEFIDAMTDRGAYLGPQRQVTTGLWRTWVAGDEPYVEVLSATLYNRTTGATTHYLLNKEAPK